MVNNIALINMKSYGSDTRLRDTFGGFYYVKDLYVVLAYYISWSQSKTFNVFKAN